MSPRVRRDTSSQNPSKAPTISAPDPMNAQNAAAPTGGTLLQRPLIACQTRCVTYELVSSDHLVLAGIWSVYVFTPDQLPSGITDAAALKGLEVLIDGQLMQVEDVDSTPATDVAGFGLMVRPS